jgi:hypothetical protein
MSDTYVVDSKGRPVIVKDPDAVLDYSWDWTDWLAPTADRIVTPTISVGGGITAGTLVRNGACGTGINYATDGSAYAVGATVLNLVGGSGTILQGDLVSVDGDLDENGNPTLYSVAVALGGGSVTLAAPGLLKAIAGAKAVTVRAVVTSMLSGGVASKNPLPFATCRVATFQNRTDDRTIYFTIKDR